MGYFVLGQHPMSLCLEEVRNMLNFTCRLTAKVSILFLVLFSESSPVGGLGKRYTSSQTLLRSSGIRTHLRGQWGMRLCQDAHNFEGESSSLADSPEGCLTLSLKGGAAVEEEEEGNEEDDDEMIRDDRDEYEDLLKVSLLVLCPCACVKFLS